MESEKPADLTIYVGEDINKRSKEIALWSDGAKIFWYPETRSHPKEILKKFMDILKFVNTGRRVVVGTHSPFILETLQVIKLASKSKKKGPLKKFLGVKKFSPYLLKNKIVKVINLTDDKVEDISDLTNDYAWGGLSSFTAEVAEALMDLQEENLKK